MALTTVNSSGIKDGEIVNADISASAAIAKSKLASLDIANADVNSNAAIDGTKISPDFGNQDIITDADNIFINNNDAVLFFGNDTGGFGTNAGIGIASTNNYHITGSYAGDLCIAAKTGENINFGTKSSGTGVTTISARILANKTFEITDHLDVGAGIDVTGAITGTTTISDSKGNVRSIPLNSQSSAYTLVAADAGKVVYISSGGVTINENVFSAGDAVTIINNSGSNQTLTEGSGNMALYNTADGTTGNRTLAGRGMCTLYWATASNAYISGSGLS